MVEQMGKNDSWMAKLEVYGESAIVVKWEVLQYILLFLPICSAAVEGKLKIKTSIH